MTPVYVYRCHECAADDIEVRHSIHEDPVIVCDDCGAQLTRVPMSFGVSLRGSGWAGKNNAGKGVEGKKPPARPIELGGTLDTTKKRRS